MRYDTLGRVLTIARKFRRCKRLKSQHSPREKAPEELMLYLVGLGLGDAKDVTVKGLEIIKEADKVFLEAYTSILTVGKDALVGKTMV